jgi:phospholipid/cholesterol/gamma-HCH transport system substrate-binding protein
VRVDFVYDDKYKVPANAKAVIISASVVSDRYVQLLPAYTGGPVLADGAHIPLARTAVPVELDRIFSSLNTLNVALGPKGANKSGALSRLLQVGADNLNGEGANIHQTVTDLSKALTTLADGKDDLFGTVRNLQVFTTALAGSDNQVSAFNTDLASVADQLAAERGDLALALKNLAIALGQVASFVKENKSNLTTDIKGLADITGTLAKQKNAIGEVLAAGPTALGNLQLAYNPSSGTLDTRDNAQQAQDPASLLCELLVSAGQPKSACAQLDKVFKGLKFPKPGKQGLLSSQSTGPDPTLGGILRSGQ